MAKEVMEGNVAVCEAAIRAGCKFYAGYPITPQTSITETLSFRIEEENGVFVQAESELAAINMVAGASAGGMRAMTATAGPGFSLMAEGMSFLCASQLPAVIVDVMRTGPGGATIRPSQSDYNYATKTLGHGGHRGFVVAPCSVQECADWTFKGFDISDKFRVPFILLSDGMIGNMLEPVELPEAIAEIPERDYIVDGCEGRKFRDQKDFERNPKILEAFYKSRNDLYKLWAETMTEYEEYCMEDAEYVIAAFGSSARISKGSIDALRDEGFKVGLIRPITLHPFPAKPFQALDPEKIKFVLTVEMTDPKQFYYDVDYALRDGVVNYSFTRSGGNMITPDDVTEAFKSHL